ncbi:MAG: urate hydroxylase PuuD [Bdellovibrio sp.]|jgi:uncharacterized membrane protein
MSWTLLSENGLMFLIRWLHYFFGVIWIGHLYYFNFVQGAYMAEADAPSKVSLQTKLLPKALWWFRWGAMGTMLTGVLYLGHRIMQFPSLHDYLMTSYGLIITIGSILGLTMWANVWFVIWPNQKVVIQSATLVSQGGAALPSAAPAGARAMVTSRINTVLSIPMLFFMGAASHLPFALREESKMGLFWILFGVIWAGLVFWGLKGKAGVLQTLRNTLIAGFALIAVLYVLLEVTL